MERPSAPSGPPVRSPLLFTLYIPRLSSLKQIVPVCAQNLSFPYCLRNKVKTMSQNLGPSTAGTLLRAQRALPCPPAPPFSLAFIPYAASTTSLVSTTLSI